MSLIIKICGLTTPESVRAAADARAGMAGFNFVPGSRRIVTPELAAALIALLPPEVLPVALAADAGDDLLAAVVTAARPKALQLHGAETPERTAAVRARFGLPVIKALPVAEARDLDAALPYAQAADWLLFDAKPAPGALPGGNGVPFDWTLLKGRRFARPWLLSGGLTPENVGDAIAASGAPGVDVSSGVERRAGVKDPALIARFAAAARAAEPVSGDPA